MTSIVENFSVIMSDVLTEMQTVDTATLEEMDILLDTSGNMLKLMNNFAQLHKLKKIRT